MSRNIVDFVYKILMVGDLGVGKSSIIERLIFNRYNPDIEGTIGVEFGTKILVVPDIQDKIKMQIWDTSGNVTFRRIISTYFESAIGAVLVYDVKNQNSFRNLDEWSKRLSERGVKHFVVVGNKCEKGTELVVSEKELKDFCKSIKAEHFYYSAVEVTNAEEIFKTLMRKINRSYISFPHLYETHQGIRRSKNGTYYVRMDDEKEKKKCCTIL
jgi:small GTP-binding protein